jgi:hypothetical protein
MKRVPLIILAASIIFFGACIKPVDPVTTSREIKLHDCISNIFSGDDIRLCFESVVSDSRCPANATCIWSGVAEVKFTFSKHSATHTFNLATLSSGTYRKDTTLMGYKIELLDLTPYPGLPPTTPPSNERKVKVKITKL